MATTQPILTIQSDQKLDTPTIQTLIVLKDTSVSNALNIDWATPSVARTVTFQDPGADDSVCYLNSTQTLTNKTLGSGITLPVTSPQWFKVSKVYTDLATAATTNSITVYTLPAGGVIHGVKVKHSVLFSGGAIATYNVSVGIVGTTAKYAPNFDVTTATSATNYQLTSTFQGESHTATTSIKLTATSTGANLDAATQGALDLWLLISTAV